LLSPAKGFRPTAGEYFSAMTERARRERTERLLVHRLDELAESLERSCAAASDVGRRLELASAATERAVALHLLSERRATAIWTEATLRHPVLRTAA
jgi:hypothetical protein